LKSLRAPKFGRVHDVGVCARDQAYFGFLAHRRRGQFLPLCRTWLSALPPPATAEQTAGTELWLCPCRQGPMRVVELLTADQITQEEGRQVAILSTS
jgi:hypothetical protein